MPESIHEMFKATVGRVCDSTELMELVNGLCDEAWDDLENSDELTAIAECLLSGADRVQAVRRAVVMGYVLGQLGIAGPGAEAN